MFDIVGKRFWFFLISGVLPEEKALDLINNSIKKTYGSKGQDIVDKNMKAVEMARTKIMARIFI